MTIYGIRALLGICALINLGLLIVSFFMICVWRNVIYKFHSKLFPMSEQTFNAIIYSYFGVYKIFIIVFNIVPYLAFSIMISEGYH